MYKKKTSIPMGKSAKGNRIHANAFLKHKKDAVMGVPKRGHAAQLHGVKAGVSGAGHFGWMNSDG